MCHGHPTLTVDSVHSSATDGAEHPKEFELRPETGDKRVSDMAGHKWVFRVNRD